MGKKEKLFAKAKNSPANLKFKELCLLAEFAGFKFRRQRGSHKIYKHPVYKAMMNFQPEEDSAKKYQVLQLIESIEEFNIILED